jgi:hypothetical protein
LSEESDFVDEKIAGAISKRYRKEEGAAIKLCAQVLGHETAG